MKSLLAMIGRKAPQVLVGGVVLGIVLPGFGNLISTVLPPLVTMLLAAAMIRVDFSQVLSHLRRPLPMALSLFFLMVLIPLAVHGLATFFELSPILHTGVVLVACAPPLASSPSMAALLGLDDALVLNVMVVGTALMPLIAPALIISILNIPIDPDVSSLLGRLALTIGIALGTAVVIRRSVGRRRIEANSDIIDGISALIMVVFAIVVMNGIGYSQVNDPWRLLQVLGLVLVANWGLHAMVGIFFMIYQGAGKSGKSLLSPQGGAIALMAGNRNMALFLAALPVDTAGSLYLFIALYQLPIYLTPALATPLYRRLLGAGK